MDALKTGADFDIMVGDFRISIESFGFLFEKKGNCHKTYLPVGLVVFFSQYLDQISFGKTAILFEIGEKIGLPLIPSSLPRKVEPLPVVSLSIGDAIASSYRIDV
ncbi:MAG: hypothetical protein NT166_12970 [Candidatus Aminicenantes bacterium]|nr:hypothetical protein [Candidatus Aminicenantes bacterium]